MNAHPNEIVLDVSELEPCEPLERTLEACAHLPAGSYLRVLHRREPFPLYELLSAQGLCYRTRQNSEAAFEIFIWGAEDTAAVAALEASTGIEVSH